MTTKLCCLLCTLVVVAGLTGVSVAEESSWKLPNLNPFAGKSQPPTSARPKPPAGSSWHLPNLMPGSGSKRTSNRPSAWQKMTNGTKSFMSKTTSALNPWDDNQAATAAKSAPAVSGSNSMFSQSTSKRTAPKADESNGSVLPASWWGGEKKEQPPKSVNEFLARPRPQ